MCQARFGVFASQLEIRQSIIIIGAVPPPGSLVRRSPGGRLQGQCRDRDDLSVKPMKMMDRPMAVSDVEAFGGCNRSTYPCLGLADRGFHVLALCESRRDGRRQRTAG